MADMDVINQAITDALSGPEEVDSDNTRVRDRKIADLVAGAEFLANQEAAKRGARSIRIQKIRPGGAV